MKTMDLISRISQHFTDSAQTKLDAIEMLAAPLAGATELMVGALVSNGKILACGNGGSAADAQHFAAELVGRFERERQGLAAIALTTDTSIITAVANDYSYKQIFEKQVRALGQPGDALAAALEGLDVLLAIATQAQGDAGAGQVALGRVVVLVEQFDPLPAGLVAFFQQRMIT